MKYKVGDKIVIKTWEQMEKEFGGKNYGIYSIIKCSFEFNTHMEKNILRINKDRIFSIKEVWREGYTIEGMPWQFSDDMISGLYREKVNYTLYNNIINRFELMDI